MNVVLCTFFWFIDMGGSGFFTLLYIPMSILLLLQSFVRLSINQA
jgi:hypothetical protein